MKPPQITPIDPIDECHKMANRLEDARKALAALVNDLQGLAMAEYGNIGMAVDYAPSLPDALSILAESPTPAQPATLTPYALHVEKAYQDAKAAGFDGLAGYLLGELQAEIASIGNKSA